MAVYTYQAMRAGEPRSRPLHGTVTADSPRHARDQLRERRLEVLEVSPLGASRAMGLLGKLLHLGSETPHPPQREALRQSAGATDSEGEGRAPFRGHFRGRGRYEAQLVAFVRELSTLLAVGTPMVEALDVALRQQRGGFGRSLLQVRDLVAAGVPLSQAMGDHPQVFDVLTRRLVDVGERAGNLDEVLERLARFKERTQSFRGRIGNALIYPAIVLTMAVLVTLLLMTLVVPNILEPLIPAGRCPGRRSSSRRSATSCSRGGGCSG
jgi:type II secretory pathway component PulF